MKESINLYSDRPIQDIEDDLLGRVEFAEKLATALINCKGQESLVVALNGDWGSGKTSLKNMAISKLKSQTGDIPDVIEFSPWKWAAQDKITEAFYREISIALGSINKSKKGKKRAKLFKKYGKLLNGGGEILTGLSSALPTLFVLSSVIGISDIFHNNDLLKNAENASIAILAAWAAALKWGGTIADKFVGFIEEKEESLDEVRTDLIESMQDNNSLIIVMDDLDRLSSEQLSMMFQLIKSNLVLPNVIFLLLFQRDIVDKQITQTGLYDSKYLEKIIQVSFDVPKIETAKVHELLLLKLSEIVGSEKTAAKMFDKQYWDYVWGDALRKYFTNLRDGYRFISVFEFQFSLFRGNDVFEINPVDFIAVECLSQRYIEVYQGLMIYYFML